MEENLKYWQANWQREIEGAFLYGELARLARTPEIRDALAEMGEQETHHAEVWAERSRQANPQVHPPSIDLRIRLTLLLGRWLGAEAVIPLLPFMFISGPAAIWTGVEISMLAHFLVGASRVIFTGRPAIRSGFEMFAVGMGVALVTFVLGLLIGGKL